MNRKTQTILFLLIALVIGACQQTAERIKGQLAKAKSESEDTSLTPEEQFALGLAYEEGGRVPKDPTQAIHWWKKAAEQGYVEAQTALGSAYWHGEGVPQNHEEALYWYRKAAMQGDGWAQGILGFAYAEGEIPQNFTEAYAWLSIAPANDYLLSGDPLRWLSPMMTPAQIERGQQRATDLRKEIQANIAERDQAN